MLEQDNIAGIPFKPPQRVQAQFPFRLELVCENDRTNRIVAALGRDAS